MQIKNMTIERDEVGDLSVSLELAIAKGDRKADFDAVTRLNGAYIHGQAVTLSIKTTGTS